MKKILSILMIAIISTMMLIAGGTKEETAKTTETGEEKIILGLYWWGNQLRNDQTKQVADLYMKMHPNIEIKMEFVDFNNYWDKLSAMATSGNVPDVIQMGYPYIAQYANNGVLAELDPYFEDGTIDISNIPDSILESGRVDGKCYALSLGSNAPCMVYDPEIVKQAGVTLPDRLTTEEFREIGIKIYEETGAYTASQDDNTKLSMKARERDSFIYDEIRNNDPSSTLEFFQMVKWLQDSPAAFPNELRTDYDTAGVENPINVGLTWNANIFSNQFIALCDSAGRHLELMLNPIDEDAVSESLFLKPAMFFSIAETSPHKKEAAEFIDWFTNSVEANEIMLAERGIPINPKVAEAIKPLVSEETIQVFDYIEKVGEVATAIDPPDPEGANELFMNLNNLVEGVRYGEITPEAATTEFIEKARLIIGE